MRSRLTVPAVFVALAAAFPLACSGTERDPVAGTGGTRAVTPGPGGQDPVGQDPAFVEGSRPDAGPQEEEACAPDPGRFDAPGNVCDDDQDGTVDNAAEVCDSALAVDANAEAFAKALGLCHKVTGPSDPKWGVVSATYTKGYNQSAGPAAGQHGILTAFGSAVAPREGDAFGVLSTGWARAYDGESGTPTFKKGGGMQGLQLLGGKVPPGYPKSSPGCPAIPLAMDIAVVKLEIKTPKNAQGFQFDFDFYSGEWPEYVCSPYNDGFIAYLKSKAFNNGAPENISFDAKGSPVSVNNAFFDRCTPNAQTGCSGGGAQQTAACAGGEGELVGTGFEARGQYCGGSSTVGGGATGWLTSQAPVQGGETITLEFYIWDSGDARYNSSVLLDNFRWVPKPVTVTTTRPPPK